VIGTQYRGADGGEGTDQFGGDDVDDVLALLPLARALPDADADRLFLLGGSRGAMQGLLAMRRGLPVRAAAFRGGLYDLPRELGHRPDLAIGWSELMPDWSRDRAGAMAQRSAINWAGELKVPIMLLHGRQDWRSHLEVATAFAGALALADIENVTLVYDHDEHQLALHRAEFLGEVVDWFRAHGAFGPP
jgi:dipeptidyl aminopeptidase/acylaminoacyl peptidase